MIKKFNEMFEDRFDYSKIIRILKKSHGWGFGVISSVDSFESNDDYFLDPEDDNDYAEKFHIYLTDVKCGKLRNTYNGQTSNIGKSNLSRQNSTTPSSIYNQRL